MPSNSYGDIRIHILCVQTHRRSSFLMENNVSLDPNRQEENERWHAMQSAFAEYRQISDALECSPALTDEPSAVAPSNLTLLEARGLAFERYMEARMEFLELRMDRCNPPAISPSNDETRSVIDAWFVPYRRFLPIALAGM